MTVNFSTTNDGTQIDILHANLSEAAVEPHSTGWDSYVSGFEKLIAEA